jgi:hypothetical protein
VDQINRKREEVHPSSVSSLPRPFLTLDHFHDRLSSNSRTRRRSSSRSTALPCPDRRLSSFLQHFSQHPTRATSAELSLLRAGTRMQAPRASSDPPSPIPTASCAHQPNLCSTLYAAPEKLLPDQRNSGRIACRAAPVPSTLAQYGRAAILGQLHAAGAQRSGSSRPLPMEMETRSLRGCKMTENADRKRGCKTDDDCWRVQRSGSARPLHPPRAPALQIPARARARAFT